MGLFATNYKPHLEELLRKANKLELKLSDVKDLVKLEKEVKEAEREDLEILELVIDLYDHSKIDKALSQGIITQARELRNFLQKTARKPEIQNALYIEQMLSRLSEFLKVEEKYLSTEPAKGAGNHIRLMELLLKKQMIVDKVKVEVRDNKIFLDRIGIKSITLSGDRARIFAEHYSTMDALKKIAKTGQLLAPASDPYGYVVVESHKLAQAIVKKKRDLETNKKIQWLLGVEQKRIEGWIKVIILAPVWRIWLRIKRGQPTHIAIEGEVVRVTPTKSKTKPYEGFEIFEFK